MKVEAVLPSAQHLAEYAQIPIGFTVDAILDDRAIDSALRGDAFSATQVPDGYWKDYDVSPGSNPMEWPSRFDVARWRIFVARADGRNVGGAVLMPPRGGDVELLPDHPEAAVLWDIRVEPEQRGRGVGRALLEEVVRAATAIGASELLVETQQINSAACRFYAANGFRLIVARRNAYPALPAEAQLIWSRTLPKSSHE